MIHLLNGKEKMIKIQEKKGGQELYQQDPPEVYIIDNFFQRMFNILLMV
jgi:hypothetical protein